MSNFAELILSADSRPLKKGEEALDSLATTAEKTERRTGEALRRVGKNNSVLQTSLISLAEKGGAALGALAASYMTFKTITTATSQALEFNKAIAETSTLIEGTPEQIRQIESAARELARTFGGTAASQTKAFYEALSAGATTVAQAKEITTAANKLAIGGNAEVAQGVDILTTALNVYTKEGLKAADASDALFIAVLAGKTTIPELATALGRVLPLAETLGVSFDETASSIAALTKAGINTNEAVTSVRAALTSIINPSADAQKLAKQLGIEFNAAGLKAKGFGAFMEEIKVKTNGSATAIQTLFGSVEATTAALSLTGSAGQFYNEIMDQMAQKLGATQAAYDKMAGSLSGRTNIAMAQFQDLMLAIGLKILPPLVAVLETLGSAAMFVADNIDRLSVYAMTAAAGFTAYLAPGFIAAAAASFTLSGALAVLSTAVIATGIGALVVLAGELIYQFTRLVEKTGSVGAALDLLKQLAIEAFDRIASAVTSVGYSIAAFYYDIKSQAALSAYSMIQSMVDFGNTAVNTFEGAYEAIKAVWGLLPAAIGEIVINAANNVITGVNDMIAKAIQPINDFIASVNSGLAAMGSTRVIPPIEPPSLPTITNKFAGAGAAAANAASTAFDSAFQTNPLEMPEFAGSLLESASQANALGTSFRNASSAMADSAIAPITAWQKIKDLLFGTETAAEGVATAAGAAGAAGAAAGTDTGNALEGAGGKAGKLKKAIDEIANAFETSLSSAIDEWSKSFADWLVKGGKDFKSFAKSLLDTFKNMIAQMIASAIANPIKLYLGLTTGMNPAQVAAMGVGGQGVDLPGVGGGTGVAGGVANAGGIFSGFFNNMFTGLKSVWTGLTSGGLSGAFGAISSALSNVGGIATGFAGLGAAIGAIAGPIGIAIALFSAFKTKTKLLDAGLRVTISNNDALVESYKKVQKSKLFGLIKSTKTSYSKASADVSDPVVKAIGDIQTGIIDSAKTLGIAEDAFNNFSYSVKISTKGLSDDEALKELQDRLTDVGDAFAGMIPGLSSLLKDGEGAAEGLQRLADSLKAVNAMTDTLGLSFEAVGLIGADIASKLVDEFGSIDAMNSATATYFQNFYSEEEQLSVLTRQTAKALADLGMQMPLTRDMYRDMIEAQDLTTESGREVFATLISLSSAMDKILPTISNLTKEISDLVDQTFSGIDELISQTNDAISAAAEAASDWYDISESFRDFLNELSGTESALISASQARLNNEVRYQQLLAATLAGDRKAARDLTRAAEDLISSGTATARSSAEAAVLQARIMSDLGMAAGVSDIYGAQQDVIASLLEEQVNILTEVRDYLSSGGTLDPAHIESLNGQLGSLQSAIEAAQAVDYASIIANLDATVTIIDGVTDPALRTLLESATDGLTATVDFIARLDGLTPAERWLALNSETEHLRTVAMVANNEIPLNLATLALNASSETERAVRIILGEDTLTEAQRAIALATSSELQRTISLTLSSDSSPEAQALALATGGDIARFVSLVVSPDMTQEARDLALTTGGLITRVVQLSIAAGVSVEAQSIALTAGGDIIRDVLVSLANGTDQNALAVALSSGDTVLRSVVASVDLSALTDEQRAFVAALSGAQTGSLVLGGSFVWNPSEGFEAWFDRVTAENVANPLASLASPMAELRASLDLLTATLREVQSSTPTAPATPTTPTTPTTPIDNSAAIRAAQEAGLEALSLRDNAARYYDLMQRTYGNSPEAAGNIISSARQALENRDRTLEAARQTVIDLGGVPAFAKGGNHDGGMLIVGENGPELKVSGPARIHNANKTQEILRNGSAASEEQLKKLVEEVRELQNVDRQLLGKILTKIEKLVNVNQDWDANGIPPTRVA